MKNLKLGITALALSVASTAFAQNTDNPWLFGVGVAAANHAPLGTGESHFGMATSGELYDAGNFTLVPAKLTIARSLMPWLALDLQASLGSMGNTRLNGDNGSYNMEKTFVALPNLGLQLKLNSLWNENSWFDPYLRVGAGYLMHDYSDVPNGARDIFGNSVSKGDYDTGAFAVVPGIGANFWLGDKFGIGLQGDYVGTPSDNTGMPQFFQGSASLLFRFGGTPKDTDGDGILDRDDACPEQAGPAENNGCPWPDADGDGVADKDDQCVNVPGPAENFGCPWPDADGDGILDKDDACPTVPGLAEYNGCPAPADSFADATEQVLADILFDFDRATIRPESNAKLDQAAQIIKDSNGGTFLIVGHTDRKGSDAYNLNLSRRRAAAVVAALEARGVSGAQLKSRGVGESEAQVAETATDAERQQDRKVQVKAVTGAEWTALTKNDLDEPLFVKASLLELIRD